VSSARTITLSEVKYTRFCPMAFALAFGVEVAELLRV